MTKIFVILGLFISHIAVGAIVGTGSTATQTTNGSTAGTFTNSPATPPSGTTNALPAGTTNPTPGQLYPGQGQAYPVSNSNAQVNQTQQGTNYQGGSYVNTQGTSVTVGGSVRTQSEADAMLESARAANPGKTIIDNISVESISR